MSAAAILPHHLAASIERSLLTRPEVERMSDVDLTQYVMSTIFVGEDRTLTDNDVANFWIVYAERNRRARRS
jgi:hypothetical protein